MTEAMNRAKLWASHAYFDQNTQNASAALLSNENDLLAAFGSELSFGTGPFYLEHSYHLAADAALSEAETKLTKDDNNPYGNIYILASDVCKPLAAANGWIWSSPGYINCMTTEIQKYPSSSELVDTLVADIPSTELYRREFSSPLWAPSFSGLTASSISCPL